MKAIARRSLFALSAMALLMAALIVIGAFNPTLAYLGNPLFRQATYDFLKAHDQAP